MYGSIKYFRAFRNVVGALVLRSVEDLMIRSFVLLVLFLFFFPSFFLFWASSLVYNPDASGILGPEV